MTHAQSSPVTRETNARQRGRPLIATLTGHLLMLREKGRRDRVEVPIEAIFDLGMKIRARVIAQQKRNQVNGKTH